MSKKRLLLISNSTNVGQAFLEYPRAQIKKFLTPINRVLFIPYAAVSFSFDNYLDKVKESLAQIGISVESIHTAQDPIAAIEDAQAIVVGGGNTFQLVDMLQQKGLLELIARRVNSGIPYIGWSAGGNIACPTLCTTNDMPIVQPASFSTMALIPFQINPHYTDACFEGHAGESREQRIEEFLELNKATTVVGLREGCMLKLENDGLELIGSDSLRIFRHGHKPCEMHAGDSLNFLLEDCL